MNEIKFPDKTEVNRFLHIVIWLVIVIGTLLRLAVYLQANCMELDEANIARNVYERGYIALAHPLVYGQYAPPVFLWLVKATTVIGGYSEYAYRFFPLLTGILTLLLMHVVLKHFTDFTAAWYVLLLLATGLLYVRFTCIAKQYAPDMLVSLLLLWLALRYALQKNTGRKLFLVWVLSGSLAIWSSMPSVFILAGVGAFYLYEIVRTRAFDKVWFLFGTGTVWLAQFALYYFLILKPQANSSYLQNYHREYFLQLAFNQVTWSHNHDLLTNFMEHTTGGWYWALVFNTTCMVIGAVYLAIRRQAKLLLLLVPALGVFLASAVHQYSVMERLLLFAVPLQLIFIAIGLQQLLRTPFVLFKLAMVVIAIGCVYQFQVLQHFVQPLKREEITEGLNYLSQQNIKGSALCIDHLAEGPYFYYTDIHPNKGNWSNLRAAHIIQWNTDLDSLIKILPSRAAMLYNWQEDVNVDKDQQAIQRHRQVLDRHNFTGGRLFIYN